MAYRLIASTGIHKGDRDYQQDQAALLSLLRANGCLLTRQRRLWHDFTFEELPAAACFLPPRETTKLPIDQTCSRSRGADNLALVILKFEGLATAHPKSPART